MTRAPKRRAKNPCKIGNEHLLPVASEEDDKTYIANLYLPRPPKRRLLHIQYVWSEATEQQEEAENPQVNAILVEDPDPEFSNASDTDEEPSNDHNPLNLVIQHVWSEADEQETENPEKSVNEADGENSDAESTESDVSFMDLEFELSEEEAEESSELLFSETSSEEDE